MLYKLGVLIMSLLMVLCGCTKISETFDEDIEASLESEISQEEGRIAKAEGQVRDFIMAINLQKYDGIVDMIYMPKNAFISDNDIKWYIDRSALGDITGIKLNELKVEISDGAIEKTAAIYVNKNGYQCDLKLDSDNQWRIILPGLYIENFSLKIPKGCSVLANGVSIDEYKTPAIGNDNYDTYVFPAVARDPRDNIDDVDKEKVINIKTSSTIFGEFEQNIKPVAESQISTVICQLSTEETENILRCIKDIWNALYTDYRNEVEIETLKKYFTSDFDNTEMTNIITAYFPALEVGPQEIGEDEPIYYTNFYCKETIPWTKDNYGAAILQSNNSVLVNFGYRIDFASTSGGVYNINKVSSITMQYDENTDKPTYKIKKIDDTKLFYDNDYSTNDY